MREAYANMIVGNWYQDRMPERIYDPVFANWLAQDAPTALFGVNTKSMLADEAKPSGDQLSALSLLPRRTFNEHSSRTLRPRAG